jgi:hypothetical protein
MNKLLLIAQPFTPFTSSWGVQCEAMPCNEGYFVPDGWQEELTARNIEFTEVSENEITFPINEQP